MGSEGWGVEGGVIKLLGHRTEAQFEYHRTEAWSLKLRTQGEEARRGPQARKSSGPGQNQASSRLAHRQVGRKTSRAGT